MLVLSKRKIKTFNPIKDRKNKYSGKTTCGTIRQKDGTTSPMSKVMVINEYGQRYNVWEINPESVNGHPAPFPEKLARDHIISWSNEGDLVLDPMSGSGTTCFMANELKRKYIGIDVSEEYCELARKRIDVTGELVKTYDAAEQLSSEDIMV